VRRRSGSEYFLKFFEGQRLTLLDILNLFPSCAPPLGHLLSCLAPLMPRYYSVTSSPLADRSIVSVALTVVQYQCVVATEVP
jgi:sulfite reductase alpha subunit-like flavoprotein